MKYIDSFDIKFLADKFGTPIYVYDKKKIVENFHKLKSAFEQEYFNTSIHFSVKSNSNLHILKIFRELNAGTDCSSPLEVLLSEKAGFTSDKIIYTGNYESLDDLKIVLEKNIRINIDDINSFYRVLKLSVPQIISFRINPGIGRGGFEGITTGGTDAKFGVPYELALEAYKEALSKGIKRFGIHMMTGSNNLEPYYFSEVVDKLLNIAGNIFNKLGIIPEYIDIGGGFGIPYDDDEQELNINLLAKLIAEVFKEKCYKFGFGTPQLIMEPGRYLVGNAGYIISKVTGIKKSYKKFVGIDAGMQTIIRPALYGARHRIEAYDKPINPNNIINICGQICENSDILASHIPFADVEEGDLVIIRDAGAYGFVMSSNYNNRPKPAEVLIENGNDKLIRKAENYQDILNVFDI